MSHRSFLFEPFHKPWVRAAGLLFSTIVGAGVLGLPYAISRVGLVIGTAYIIGMGLLVMSVHLVLGELVLRTKKHAQMTGIIRTYLGSGAAILMAIVFLALHIGAMTAYLIGCGQSLGILFGGRPFAWSLLFFLCGTLIIVRGTKVIATFDYFMNIATIIILFFISAAALGAAEHFPLFPTPNASLFLPYGVLLFAFHGTSAIPEMELITGRDPKQLRAAIIAGSLLPILLYLLFAVAVVLVTGRETTDIATIGLGQAIGPGMIWAGNIFAIIAMCTSFVMIGQALRRTFQWDFGFRPAFAIACATGIPLGLYLLGAREFVRVIAIIGALFGTIEFFLILWAYRKAHSAATYEENRNFRWWFWWR